MEMPVRVEKRMKRLKKAAWLQSQRRYAAGIACATGVAAQQPAPSIVITHDGHHHDRQPAVEDRSVVISGNRIVAIGPSSNRQGPGRQPRRPGRGKFLIPGLWDMHAHLPDDSTTRALMVPLYLANGVTGLRDMWGDCEAFVPAPTPPVSLRPRQWSVPGNTTSRPARCSDHAWCAAGNALRGPQPSFPGMHAVRDSADGGGRSPVRQGTGSRFHQDHRRCSPGSLLCPAPDRAREWAAWRGMSPA